MSTPADPTNQLPPVPKKAPDKKPGGDVPMEPNPYMGGGGIPA